VSEVAVVSEESGGKNSFRTLLLGCIGVVYGDIGTSPLYAFREAAHHVSVDGNISPVEIYGLLSLIIWSLIVIVTIKYVLFLLKIDNRGEGGILSLMAMARKAPGISVPVVFGLGMLGAGLFYGDSAITPAISVLSAVEGLKIATPHLERFVLPLSLAIIILLFMAQKHGTDKIARLFGPITAVWFLAIAAAGSIWIVKHPEILFSFSPTYAVEFVLHHGWTSFFVLSSVCLAVTGAEALYADMGHFGRKPIQVAWLFFVFPCLVLNYLGQGALIMENPEAIANTFYLLVPEWALWPMIGLATAATIIASQAVITGAYSISRQAIQLGFLPRMEIRHTSADQHGQIFMPQINRWLLYTIILLCLIFGTSSNLAAAYGIAVMGTMVVSTILAFIVVWKVRQKSLFKACIFLVPLFFFEGTYLASNMVKLFDGGFVPLFIAGFTVLSMFIWVKGTKYLHKKAKRQAIPLSDLLEKLDRKPPAIVEGTAVYLTSDPADAPIAMLQNLKHNKVLHQKNVVLSVVNSQFPKVPETQRIVVDRVSSSITKMFVHYGFMETPHIPHALLMAKSYGVDTDLDNVSYFLGRRSIVPDPLRGLPGWQEHIFLILLKSSTAATDFYKLPPDRVVELGVQMAI
jgi:KUP system potassium uptake protein